MSDTKNTENDVSELSSFRITFLSDLRETVQGPLTESQFNELSRIDAEVTALMSDIIGRLQRKGKGRIFVQETLGK